MVWRKAQGSKLRPWVSSESWHARRGQGNQQTRTSSQHNTLWEDLSCPEEQSDRQNGHDSPAGQKQILLRKFQSHHNPTTVGTTIKPHTVQKRWMQQVAFERRTTLLRVCSAPASPFCWYYLNCHDAWVKAKQLNYSGKAWHCLWLRSISQPLPSLSSLNEYAALLKILRNGLGIPHNSIWKLSRESLSTEFTEM